MATTEATRKSSVPKRIPAKTKGDDSFEAVAKRLECDMDEGRFKEKLGKIARANPQKKAGS